MPASEEHDDALEEVRFSDELEAWLSSPGRKTIGDLAEVFEERTFAVGVMLTMMTSALPLPTGGVTHVFVAIAGLIAAQMVIGLRTLWLPERWQQRDLGALATERALPFMVRRIRWFERYSRPRFAGLFEHRNFVRLVGLELLAFAVAAWFAPPFSGLDTLPAMGAVVICLSIVLGDVVILLVGSAIGVGGIALILTLGTAVVRFVRELF